jgi:hypothetical protein
MDADLKLLQTGVILYPMWIEDLEERRRQALIFESATKCGNFLGCGASAISYKIARKHYCYHRDTKKQYAPRYYSNNK